MFRCTVNQPSVCQTHMLLWKIAEIVIFHKGFRKGKPELAKGVWGEETTAPGEHSPLAGGNNHGEGALDFLQYRQRPTLSLQTRLVDERQV